MHLAAKFDQIELVEWIINYEGVRSIKELMYNGASCLHFACASSSFRCIKKIIEAVPSLVNNQMMNGVTSLYLGYYFIYISILFNIKSLD